MTSEAHKNHTAVISSGKDGKPKRSPGGDKAAVSTRHAVEDHQERLKAKDEWSYE